MDDIDKFTKAFADVRKLGFVKSNRPGNTGIGKTLEDIMNIKENNIDSPDLFGFEIKSQRAFTGSRVTLFTRAPNWPKGANTILRQNYGIPDRISPTMKVLHTTISACGFNTHASGYGFKLNIDHASEKVFLEIKDLNTEQLENFEVYWTFEVLKEILAKKLNKLVFIEAKTEKRSDGEYFHFNKANMYFGTSLNKFFSMLEEKKIIFEIRIGVNRKTGKTHDHGSGPRLKKVFFSELFDDHCVI